MKILVACLECENKMKGPEDGPCHKCRMHFFKVYLYELAEKLSVKLIEEMKNDQRFRVK